MKADVKLVKKGQLEFADNLHVHFFSDFQLPFVAAVFHNFNAALAMPQFGQVFGNLGDNHNPTFSLLTFQTHK